MGLDMYLQKVKRIEGVTPKELIILDQHFDYLARPESDKNLTMKEWCNYNFEDVCLEKSEIYKLEYIHRYSLWDEKKEYGYKTIFQTVAQWRKANQIHRWFVDNIQKGNDDCGIYEVSKEDLCTLINICKKVKKESELIKGELQNGSSYINGKLVPNWVQGEKIKNYSVAETLLPTMSGFFFGGTAYDQWYLEDVSYTIEALEKVVTDIDFTHEIVMYSSSW